MGTDKRYGYLPISCFTASANWCDDFQPDQRAQAASHHCAVSSGSDGSAGVSAGTPAAARAGARAGSGGGGSLRSGSSVGISAGGGAGGVTSVCSMGGSGG